MIREIRDIQDFLKLALDASTIPHKHDWSHHHAAFNLAFDDLEKRLERLDKLERQVQSLLASKKG